MFSVQIARGKSSFKTAKEFPSEPEATEFYDSVNLKEGQKVRIKNTENGDIIARRVYDDSEPTHGSDETDELEFNRVLAEYHEQNVYRINLTGQVDAWDTAIDVVNYPVRLVPAYYRETDESSGEHRYERAAGTTNTGRDTEFYFVQTDKLRTGAWNTIAPFTGRYAGITTAQVYDDMKECLEGLKHEGKIKHDKPNSVYVSGDGGRQRLIVDIPDRNGLQGRVHMRLVLDTSSDGSKAHSVSMIAYDKQGKTSINFYGGQYKLSNKHTTNAIQQAVDFAPAIGSLIEAWDDEIIPAMQLLNDHEFDRNMAIDFLESLSKDAGVSKRHRTKLIEGYNGTGKTTLFEVVSELSQYIDAMKSEELQDRMQEGLAKAITKQIKRLSK